VRRISQIPMTAGVVAREAYSRMKASGLALQPLLHKAGITRYQIENRSTRLRVSDQIQFLNLVSSALRDDLLGFHLGERVELRKLGLFYYVLASSETLVEVFSRAARYISILNEGVVQACVEGRQVGIAGHYAGVSRHLDRHQTEFWAVVMLRMVRKLAGIQMPARRVRMVHVRPGSSELNRAFGCKVEFGSKADEITFAGSARRLPVVNADSYLNRLLLTYCEDAVAHRSRGRESARSTVENAIAPVLPHGGARAGGVARRLGVSQRTLARRLAAEGLTFSGVLSDLKRDLALRYLAEKELTVSQIAWLLGYQGVGAFSHAFKRWTGKAPSHAAFRR
jgi:AraC-like DNA-binding protein